MLVLASVKHLVVVVVVGGAEGVLFSEAASDNFVDLLPPPLKVPGCTQYLTDLWLINNVQELLSYMGHNSKIRPIFVLYEWCSVIFL